MTHPVRSRCAEHLGWSLWGADQVRRPGDYATLLEGSTSESVTANGASHGVSTRAGGGKGHGHHNSIHSKTVGRRGGRSPALSDDADGRARGRAPAAADGCIGTSHGRRLSLDVGAAYCRLVGRVMVDEDSWVL